MNLKNVKYIIDGYNGIIGIRFNDKEVHEVIDSNELKIMLDDKGKIIGFDVIDADERICNALLSVGKSVINSVVNKLLSDGSVNKINKR